MEDRGRWLARILDPEGQGLWPTTWLGRGNDPCNIQSGAAVVGLFLCQAIAAGGDPALRDPVRTAAE